MNKRLVFAVVPVFVIIASSIAHAADKPAAAQAGQQQLRLPKVIGSHMVLQRDIELPIWGWAQPQQKVTVRLGENEKTTTAGADGKWMVRLSPMKAGGPHKMTVSSEAPPGAQAATIELEDILVGEVWVCSGQSNMEWSLAGSKDSKSEIPAADYPKIRLFHVPKVSGGEPAADVNAAWKACTPETVPGFSGVAYFFGREIHKEMNVPVGLINASWGGSAIQPWTPAAGYELVKGLAGESSGRKGDSTMFNGMIHPLVPFAIRGALWYQGESNVAGAPAYCDRMKALIGGWRKVWQQGDFPFYYVQLAPYGRYKADVLPAMWEAQTAAMEIPNTGMVVITDLVDNVMDIHPRNKKDVGERLALWAMAKVHGCKDLVYSGPLYKSMSAKGGKVVVEFDHAGGGLTSSDSKPLTWFTIAGKDRRFVEAKAEIVGQTIEVSSDKVPEPVAVRFGWSNVAQPNLVNKEGLPASPFRTDRW
jgi:sialate O-acetylesterase